MVINVFNLNKCILFTTSVKNRLRAPGSQLDAKITTPTERRLKENTHHRAASVQQEDIICHDEVLKVFHFTCVDS